MKFLLYAIFFNLYTFNNFFSYFQLKNPLILEIKTKQEKIKIRNDIVIEVRLINTNKEYIVFYNKLFLDKREAKSFPASNLIFYISDGKTIKELEYIGYQISEKLQAANLYDFITLPPNFFWGQIIHINENAYKFIFEEGGYSIKAVFETNSKSWLIKNMERFSIKNIPFEIDKVFDGKIYSNEIFIEIYK